MATAILEQRIMDSFDKRQNNWKMRNKIEVIPILTPAELKEKYPITDEALFTVENSRNEIQEVLDRKSDKVIAIFGPCSIHDFDEAYELAEIIERFSRKVNDKIIVIKKMAEDSIFSKWR